MAKKKMRKRKHQPWNKGRATGQRDPFSRSEVNRIRKRLAKRGDAGLRDLALFSTAIDTMLRAPDLLSVTVKDVRKRNRMMRDTLHLTTARGGRGIRCTLSKATTSVLEEWINRSGKKPGEYLFTGRTGEGSKPITSRQLSRLVKAWAEDIGRDASQHGLKSLRRPRPSTN